MVNCIEYVDMDESGVEHPIDPSAPNPNGEFDNLYLDMNGIIHPCTHPEDRPPPETEEQMFDAIFDYTDRIFSIVRPRKLLYMAIDGVAPRAKINQQRSRRFRSAKEAEEKILIAEQLKGEWDKMGLKVEDEGDDDTHLPFDSNVITPGTPFMARLAVALRGYVNNRIANNPGWRDIAVIFSDASVPGEGEHKIAEYIRRERAELDYNPNLRHVMYGLDADLIMLALATHEVNFTILREEVFPKRGGQRQGDSQHQQGRGNERAPKQIDTVMAAQAEEAGFSTRAQLGGKKPFHFLHVNILREYLDYEFKTDIENEIVAVRKAVDIAYDLERVIDDFVFLCFFVGNDFLPHLPTLDIREGAIDFLIELYKTHLPHIGYLTCSQGQVDFVRVRELLGFVGQKEDEVFKERSQREQHAAERAAREKEQKKQGGGQRAAEPNASPRSPKSPGSMKRASTEKDKGYQEAAFSMHTVELGRKGPARIGSGEASAAAEAALKARLMKIDGKGPVQSKKRKVEKVEDGTNKVRASNDKSAANGLKNKRGLPVVLKTVAEFKEATTQRMREKNELEVVDTIKLGEAGWKERYYQQKFGWGPQQTAEKMVLLHKYVEGLQWVMKYYYVGCMSWGWYYPYHYAPFASDLVECDLTENEIVYKLGKPFEPFSQLQAVMPPSSGKLVLPKCYSDLMTDPSSPIIDYYPENFEIDLNGKRFAWQGVALLPFIDEKRLNDALVPLKDLLTDEEKERNSFGDTCVIVHKNTHLGKLRSKKESEDGSDLKRIPAEAAWGQLFGKTSYPLSNYGGTKGAVYTLVFHLPTFKPHSSQLLLAAIVPPSVLNDAMRANCKYSGWKQARFGSLGRAAKDLSVDRNRRTGNGTTSGSRSRARSGGMPRTGFIPEAPVINGPVVGTNAAVSNMFGGLGAQNQPNWMRSSRNTYQGAPAPAQAHLQAPSQGAHYNYYPHHQPLPQQHLVQPMQQLYNDAYREPSEYGGYYATGFQHRQSGWDGLQQTHAGWQPRNTAHAGWGSGAVSGSYGGYDVNGYQDAGSGGEAYYDSYHGQGGNSGTSEQRRGGLAGPTAGSLRIPHGSGRGHAQGQFRDEQGRWDNSGYQ